MRLPLAARRSGRSGSRRAFRSGNRIQRGFAPVRRAVGDGLVPSRAVRAEAFSVANAGEDKPRPYGALVACGRLVEKLCSTVQMAPPQERQRGSASDRRAVGDGLVPSRCHGNDNVRRGRGQARDKPRPYGVPPRPGTFRRGRACPVPSKPAVACGAGGDKPRPYETLLKCTDGNCSRTLDSPLSSVRR